MTAVTPLERDVLRDLRKLSTPTVCNVIERFRIRLRNEGYIGSALPRRVGGAEPLVGYAFPVRMRTGSPPAQGLGYPDTTDWWNVLSTAPRPVVVVIQDVDSQPMSGSVAGEVHAAIFKAFGAVGLVTNGAVRDVEALARMNLHVYAAAISPSHAYAHIVDIGRPVELAGLTIKSGDLLHGDDNGLVSIPPEIAADLPAAAQKLLVREKAIIELCGLPSPSTSQLQSLIAAFERVDAETF